MRTNNKNKSAQPLTWIDKVQIDSHGHTEDVIRVELGLTKREYFAGLAMQGLLSNSEWMKNYQGEKYIMPDDVVAQVSIQFADELLKQLER